MESIDRVALEREVMSMATEDMYGLYEIIWTLNRWHPEVDHDKKIRAARDVVAELGGQGLIEIHRLEWHPARDLGTVPSSELTAVLSTVESWEPGQTYVGFMGTEEGVAEYSSGRFTPSE